MIDDFRVNDWYWVVADTDPVNTRYSTAARAFVPVTNAAYRAWLGIFTPTPVDTLSNLVAVLRNRFPAGLPAAITYNYSVEDSLNSRRNLLVNPEFRVNQRDALSAFSGSFGPDLWIAAAANITSTAPVYDPATGLVTTAGGFASWRQDVDRTFWSAGFPGETMTVSVEDLEFISGAPSGLSFNIGGEVISLLPGLGIQAATFIVPAASAGPTLSFRMLSGGAYKYRSLALVRGSEPFNGQPRNLEEETALSKFFFVLPEPNESPTVLVSSPAPGTAISLAVNASALGTILSAANRIDYMPLVLDHDVTASSMGLDITVGVVGASVQLAIYNDIAGEARPGALLNNGPVLSVGIAGFVSGALQGGPIVLKAKTRYWIAVHSSLASTYRALNLSASVPLGRPFSGATGAYTLRRASQPFASGLPLAGGVTTLTSALVPLVLLEVA